MEQRKQIRTAIYAPVEVSTGKLTCHELIQNISLDGAFIQTPRRLPVGEPLILLFTFPSYEETISLACQVVRNDAKGIGIQFTDNDADVVAALKDELVNVSPA